MASHRESFDLTIGRLDRILSELMEFSRADAKGYGTLDGADRQTLKHHAEDMIAAGQAILVKLGKDQAGTPQPRPKRGANKLVEAFTKELNRLATKKEKEYGLHLSAAGPEDFGGSDY